MKDPMILYSALVQYTEELNEQINSDGITGDEAVLLLFMIQLNAHVVRAPSIELAMNDIINRPADVNSQQIMQDRYRKILALAEQTTGVH